MPSSSPNAAEPRQLLVAGRSGEHAGPGAARQLHRGDADAAPPGVDQDGLSRLESSELEETIVGRAERHRDTGRLVDGEPGRHRPAERRRARPAARHASRRDRRSRRGRRREKPSTSSPAATTVPGTLVPHDVRAPRRDSPMARARVSPPSMLIASTRTKRSPSARHGVRDVLVAQAPRARRSRSRPPPS